MRPKQFEYFFFLGIGGIGMSALARFFQSQGKRTGGYDKTSTTLTKNLEEEGIPVIYNDSVDAAEQVLRDICGQKRIPKTKVLIVRTPAVPEDHPALVYFTEMGFTVMKRAEVLGLISASYFNIAVAGTHGKTTTSTLIAHILKQAGVDVQAFLGGISSNYETNFIESTGQFPFVVLEADEFDRSFLHLTPDIAIVTSTDPDHLDIYGQHEALKESFVDFTKRLREDGFCWINSSSDILSEMKGHFDTYSIHREAPFMATNIKVGKGRYTFSYVGNGIVWKNMYSGLPGRHNVENAVAAIAVAQYLGLDEKQIRKGLTSFKGVKRRFEKVWQKGDRIYIDDYAHHPTELSMAIQSARELYPGFKIVGAFQPHLFSRTRDFMEGFAKSLDALDECYLMPIYPAREKPLKGIHSERLAELMKKCKGIFTHDELVKSWSMKKVDQVVYMTLGAGDIDRCVMPIHQMLKTKYS